MRRIPFLLLTLTLILIWGCSTEKVTAPASSDQATESPAAEGPVVTLAQLKAGFGDSRLAGADVAVTQFTVTPAVVQPGDVLTMQAAVENLGSDPAVGPFDVWIGVLGTGFEFARLTIDQLLVGEGRSGTVNFTIPVAKFAKAYPPGVYTLYCTHDFSDVNPANNYQLVDVELQPTSNPVGDVNINVTPDGIGAGWTVTGPQGFTQSGTEDALLTGLPIGVYNVTWTDVANYQTPSPQTGTLTEGALLMLAGQYVYFNPSESLRMYFAPDMFSCTTGAFLDHITAYIVYENPTLAEIRGFECGYDLTLPAAKGAAINTAISVSFPVSATDVGVDDAAAGTYNRIVGYSGPIPTSQQTILATLDIFILDSGEIDITMREASPQSPPLDGNPKVVKSDFSLLSVPAGYASGSPALIINGGDPCGVTLGK